MMMIILYWFDDQNGPYCYHESITPMNWSQALDYCQTRFDDGDNDHYDNYDDVDDGDDDGGGDSGD